MKWGSGGRAVSGAVIVALVVALLVLLHLTDDPRETAVALWRAARFPFGFVLGGLALATLFDRGGRGETTSSSYPYRRAHQHVRDR